jgi:serine/threonine protein kinase
MSALARVSIHPRSLRRAQGRLKLERLDAMPEAQDLLRRMLRKDPRRRLSMAAVMAHPLWWPPSLRLAFLIALSDRVENEDREVGLSVCPSVRPAIQRGVLRADFPPIFCTSASVSPLVQRTAGGMLCLVEVKTRAPTPRAVPLKPAATILEASLRDLHFEFPDDVHIPATQLEQ